ncbi:MAG: complex I NDUFA9 subunit family protein [Gammaproteobacteria bacterium]|jgi:NADH dehydrogenase|nr:complex I NDUFA9 subunit family protein [Gammaproteobacteria bacterium]
MADQKICIIGGSGFVGRHLAHRLTREGWRVTIPTRRRERQRALLVDPRVTLIEADVHDPATLRGLIAGCDAVVNLVGILNEHRGPAGQAFARAHVALPEKIVAAMRDAGVRRLLHMSALNADPREAHSLYLRTKGQGEDLVHGAAREGLEVTSFRPSVIFGPGDSFFNRFATLLRLTPLVFPLACAESRFSPVYVGDVVEAMARALRDRSTIGKHCDLCGPEVYTLAQLVEYTADQLGLRRRIWRLNDALSRLQARALEFVPGKPFSRDNYWSLQKDSVCGRNGLIELGIRPTAVDAVVPGYLGRRGARGAYQRFRERARRG